MPDLTTLGWTLLLAAVFTVAFFYSSVGHGGATGISPPSRYWVLRPRRHESRC